MLFYKGDKNTSVLSWNYVYEVDDNSTNQRIKYFDDTPTNEQPFAYDLETIFRFVSEGSWKIVDEEFYQSRRKNIKTVTRSTIIKIKFNNIDEHVDYIIVKTGNYKYHLIDMTTWESLSELPITGTSESISYNDLKDYIEKWSFGLEHFDILE